jgi:pimeloyl-ACP methyl ester carboxylesterase
MRALNRLLRYPSRYVSVLTFAFALALFGSTSFMGCDTLSDPDAGESAVPVLSDAPAPVADAAGPSCITGTQSSGSLYELCLPEGGNPTGTLVLFAHGFVFPQLPIALPEDDDFQAFFLREGFAYGTTSFDTNGLVNPKTATKDLRELITIHTRNYGRPERVLLFGVSNGALLSTLAIEQHPGLFDGGLAVCGPIGSYVRNVDYLGDIFVVFDALFPTALDDIFGVEAGGPEGINPAFLQTLFTAADNRNISPRDYLANALQGILLQANGQPTQDLLTMLDVLKDTDDIAASFEDPTINPAEGLGVVITAVVYNVFETNDLIEKTGGFAYDNVGREYAVIDNDLITRYASNRNARRQLETKYETSGRLRVPLVALHTTRDPLVPFWQEAIYDDKVRDPSLFSLTEFERYGHCTFTSQEVAVGFAELLNQVSVAPAEPL